MKRRDFLRSSALGAVTLSSFPHHLYVSDVKKYPNDRVVLGSSGIETSRMAMGTGTHGYNKGSNQTRQLGMKGLSDMLCEAYNGGITFFDTADGYGSHPHIGAALKRLPREKIVVLTKTGARTAEKAKQDLDRFRKELGTDYIDIILLHGMRNPDWNIERKMVMDVLSQAREDGIIRAHGVSCHSLSAVKTSLNESWSQVTLARFNPFAVNMDGSVEEVKPVLQKFESKNKGLIAMKVFGEGELVDRKDECLQFVISHPFVQSFTIGVENPRQLKDLQKRIPEASVRA